MSRKFIELSSTFFYIGKFPFAPGTLASFVGALIAIIFFHQPFVYILLTIAVTVLGFCVCGQMEKIVKEKDPSCVVIDEVAGIMISLFALPLTTPIIVVTFFLFRAFDMFKIYPVNKLEEMNGAAGIMTDDLVAGIYTNFIMQVAIRWAGIS